MRVLMAPDGFGGTLSPAQAATALARDHSAGRALAADLARISGLVQERLARVASM